MAMTAAARAELIEAHLPLVRTLALRFARRGEPLDDLVQAGAIGLIHAVDRYDPNRGNTFEAYAVPTITGEIRRHLRDRCAPVHIPRRTFEEHARIVRTGMELAALGGRQPSMQEIAHAASVPLDAVAAALDPPRVEPLDEGELAPEDPIGALDERLALATALRALPVRERRILLLAFYGERSQRRIADEEGLSQIHVSRLLRAALARLHSTLEEGVAVARPAQEA
jgi:RNA polymerase sigma-B factor